MFEPGPEFAALLDRDDPLASFRDEFELPATESGEPVLYLVGNSLGLQPRATRGIVLEELDSWATRGVRGHFEGKRPWAPYHEFLAEPMARLVGAEPQEVVVMNGLTVNLHLLMVSFYRPTAERHRILIEEHAFPSDRYAVESQIRHHGYDPATALITVSPEPGEEFLEPARLLAAIDQHGPGLALVLLPGVQYYTGQVFPMPDIVAAARSAGATVGFDLAHAAGNIELALHDWAPDFAAWCTYKYLNGGPGATAAAFVHHRHLHDPGIDRFNGWWGHDKATRFAMGDVFQPIPTAEAWQLSNAPVLSMAPLIASLGVFDAAGGMRPLRAKSRRMAQYFDYLLDLHLDGAIESITPRDLDARGCQLSLRVRRAGRSGRDVIERLHTSGVECDWREPDVIRVATVPLYNTYRDIHRFVEILRGIVT